MLELTEFARLGSFRDACGRAQTLVQAHGEDFVVRADGDHWLVLGPAVLLQPAATAAEHDALSDDCLDLLWDYAFDPAEIEREERFLEDDRDQELAEHRLASAEINEELSEWADALTRCDEEGWFYGDDEGDD